MSKSPKQEKYNKIFKLLSAALKIAAPVVMGIMAVVLPIAIGFPDITIWSVGFLLAFLLLDIWLIKTSNAYNKIFVVAGIVLMQQMFLFALQRRFMEMLFQWVT